MELKGLSTRELQACGAACLAKFCAVKGIQSRHVEKLIEHLLRLMMSTNLPAWESEGSMLELTGLGDPVPADLEESLPPDSADDFMRLVSYVVEIGMVDMYGSDTKEPLKFLLKSRAILRSSGVEPPSVEELLPMRSRQPVYGWGEPLSEEEYRRVRDVVRKNYVRGPGWGNVGG